MRSAAALLSKGRTIQPITDSLPIVRGSLKKRNERQIHIFMILATLNFLGQISDPTIRTIYAFTNKTSKPVIGQKGKANRFLTANELLISTHLFLSFC